MTLDKAPQLLKVHADFGGFYNADGAKLILAEVSREYGQAAVNQFVRELDLERIFASNPAASSAAAPRVDSQRAFVRAARDFQPAPCMAAIRSFANSTKVLTSTE